MQEIYFARLDRAIHMLARTNYPIAVIAAMTGFCQDSHLNNHCLKNFGCCSSDLRKALHDGKLPYPQPRSPLLTGPTFGPVPPPTPIPPESLPHSPHCSARKYRKRKRRREMINQLARLFRSRPQSAE